MLLLQHESDFQVDLVAYYVAILDQNVLVLNPRAFDAPERLGSAGNGLIDGILEARLGRSAQLRDSGNTHTYLCLLILACSFMPHLWPNEVDSKHWGRDTPKDTPARLVRGAASYQGAFSGSRQTQPNLR